jgi:carbamoyl-phosphate synthase small subunit
MLNKTTAKLILEDGSEFYGESFGAEVSAAGETVFNTAMTGYPENLTDPSYRGQILVTTYPLMGNYGVPNKEIENGLLKNFESENIQISGLVVADYSDKYSHWNAQKSLSEWMKENGVPGITGIDTRALTRRLREKGCMLGKIVKNEIDTPWVDPNKENLVEQVSISEKKVYGNGKHRILLIDCGVKLNIIRCLLKRDTTIIRVPWDHDIKNEQFDGLFISNGPGDPEMYSESIASVKWAMDKGKPVFGICLGSQLMALAAGGETYKLKYGHRSHNQPVRMCGTPRCFITSQNHGFAVDYASLPMEWESMFMNLNDDTLEGIKHRNKPFFSSQFHPEASSGPVDTEFLFDDFIAHIKKHKRT